MSLPHSSYHPETGQRRTSLDVAECAVLTGIGRSAIAVIGLRGRKSKSIIERSFAPATPMTLKIGQIRYGNWTGSDPAGQAQESVVVTPIAEDRFEIHCHGGSAAIARIIGDLRACGAIQIENTDWTEVKNLLICEARQVLAQCLTARTAAIAMDQVRGALADWVQSSIDAPAEPTKLAKEAEEIVTHAPLTTRLSDPFRVVLVGPPNVGKSSLVNAMVGYDRSITFDQSGTTRDVLHADTVIDGIPIRLSDTAGIRESDEAIEKEGIARAKSAAEQADLVLIVNSPETCSLAAEGSSDERPKALLELTAGLAPVPNNMQGENDREAAILSIFNKTDLLGSGQKPPGNSIPTNAVSGAGIPELLETIADHLGQLMPDPGQPAPLTKRQADLLRKLAEAKSPSIMQETLAELLRG